MRGFIAVGAALFITGCSIGGDTGRSIFDWVVSHIQIGSSRDVWLVKGSIGIEDRVGLIFGYNDDLYACQDIADAMNEKYPAARYYCKNAN